MGFLPSTIYPAFPFSHTSAALGEIPCRGVGVLECVGRPPWY